MLAKKYFQGFDYLRVFFAFAIVAWHSKAFGLTDVFSSLGTFRVSIVDVIYFNVFLVGVPLFIQIALFLYVYNRQSKDNYFLKRIKHLVLVYSFWVFWSRVFLTGQFSFEVIASAPVPFLVSGGFSHLYFLFAVLMLTVSTEIMIQLKKVLTGSCFLYLQYILLLIFSFVLPFKHYIASFISNPNLKFIMINLGPVDFLPYIFSTFIFFHYYQHGEINWQGTTFKKIMAIMVPGYLTFVIIEWQFLPSDN
ncbi:MAG: acyltransferase family protein [Carboxydocellales bacterium]